MRSQVEDRTSTTKAREFRNPKQDEIRKNERLLLDIWSNQYFFAGAVIFTLYLLYVFTDVVGPPPDDGRCTLPWC